MSVHLAQREWASVITQLVYVDAGALRSSGPSDELQVTHPSVLELRPGAGASGSTSRLVEETVVMPVSEPGGPYGLALSARSDTLRQFDGGPGQIAIHGRDSLGGTPGLAESHGCMRLSTPNIDWLAGRIGPGTRVRIR